MKGSEMKTLLLVLALTLVSCEALQTPEGQKMVDDVAATVSVIGSTVVPPPFNMLVPAVVGLGAALLKGKKSVKES